MQQIGSRNKPTSKFAAAYMLIAPLLGISGGVVYARYFQHPNLPTPTVVPISSEVVIGAHPQIRGQADSPVTLVEFGDYFCPSCRTQNADVNSLLAKHKGHLKFVFRNLPLKRGSVAPLLAESAGKQGYFWQMHDFLYQSPKPVSLQDVDPLLSSWHLDKQRFHRDFSSSVPSIVASDVATAKVLKLSFTPTFLLCLPDKTVLWLTSVEQAESYLASSTKG